MPTKVTDTVLPTTMIGSYPKPRWYQHYNLAGEDLLEWWKLEENWHAYWDATTACIKDQELAGLDSQAAWMHNWGGTAVTEPVSRGIPGRLAEMYEVASQLTDKPLKVSVGAGPPNLTYHVDFNAPGSKYTSARRLAEDLVPIFNADLKELAARGARFIQIEDLGAWMLALDDESDWVIDVLNAWIDGVNAKIAWHCCLGAGYGNTFRAVKVLEHIEPERVYLSTDCGLKALPRFCAFQKLKALSRAAARVREEVGAAAPVAAAAG